VAYQIQLVDKLTVNGIIAMILASCIASPWITERWGSRMKPAAIAVDAEPETDLASRVLVPVANPSTEDNLLQLAILLTKRSQGTLLPLHVLVAHEGRASAAARMQQTQLLTKAEEIAHASVTSVQSVGRLDSSIDLGIVPKKMRQAL